MAQVIRSVFLALGLFLGAGFAAAPLIAAYQLHEAITRGDTKAIEAAVDWAMVRHTLKTSISRAVVDEAKMRRNDLSMLRRIGYRLGDAFAPYLVDRMIAQKVSPQGFIDYMRQPLPASARKRSTLQMIERAAYAGFNRFEIDIRDRIEARRRYRAVFTRSFLSWRLTEVRLLASPSRGLTTAAVH